MSSSLLATHLSDHSSSFREDAPRPPVPGEEGQTPCQLPMKSQRSKPVPVSSNPRRDEGGLGEPEGSASPDSPLVRWTKSLHSLLGDKEGADLFRTFLEREKCVDTLDFWFACNGFRQMDLKDTKTLRVAKAIYKRYIESCGIISKQLKTLTKSFLRDSIKKQHIKSTMFDQAQSEIQAVMEDNAYQVFLTSDIYLEYVRSGGENAAYFSNVESGSLKAVSGYLPTLNEEEEWSCVDLKQKTLTSVVGLSSKALRATINLRAKETAESGYRSYKRKNLINPYHINSGHVFAPATSANESEISSDALTDDSLSVTDSSVDGIPPYRMGSKKQLQWEMARSVKANGLVSLPPFPRTHQLPREMTPVEPSEFAAELIVRLEKVKEKQEEKDSLEEQNITEEEEEEEEENFEIPMCIQPTVPPHQPLPSLSLGSIEEDPQAILDDHLSRVLKTPGCQSPGMERHSPCPHSPDRPCPLWPTLQPVSPCALLAKGFVTKQTTKHVHHHYIHHHAAPKSKAEIEAEAARRVQCMCSSSSKYCCYLPTKMHSKNLDYSLLPPEHAGIRCGSISRRCCKMADCPDDGPIDGTTFIYQLPGEEITATSWQRVVEFEKERQSRHKAHSLQHIKKYPSSEPRSSSAERTIHHHTWGTCSGHQRNLQPSHLSAQEQAVSPVPPPSTLAQLEEACRRLTEVSKPPKQRCSVTGQQRIHPVPSQLVPSPNTTAAPASDDQKEPKMLQPVPPHSPNELMVTYFFCEEKIPYRWMLKSHSLTLGHFKEQLSKKGNYRYYFKKASQEFECGAVFEEIREDNTMLPTYEGRVLGKVERID